jgi:hypothetical protein
MTPPDVLSQLGLTDYNQLTELLEQLDVRAAGNNTRQAYYDMHNMFQDLGIAVPPQLRTLEVAMGWPAKAVDLLSRRVRLDSYVLPDGDVADWGIPQIMTDNRMETEAPQATVTTLTNSPAFIMTTVGNTSLGEPELLLSFYDATQATGIWEPARRGLRAWLGVRERNDFGEPTSLLYLTPTLGWGITKQANGRWDCEPAPTHGLGRVPVEPLVYRANLRRPFGSSRINRAVMAITNSAMRTVVRSEVGAEFYSSPQRYLLGAEESMFVGPDGVQKHAWDLVTGRILAVPGADEDGAPPPSLGQFPQVSMQPHTDHLRMWATLFAGETSIPVSSLGVVQDNPASAEAIYAAKEDLVIEAEGVCEGFTPAYIRAMQTGVQMRDRLAVLPDELRGLGLRWRDPSTPSRAAATDAVMKQVQAGVLPADSDVALEQLGYDDTTIRRIQADRRRASGSAALRAITDAIAPTAPPVGPPVTPAAAADVPPDAA